MTAGELKEYLEGIDDNVEVRIAHQPSWPFEYEINSLRLVEEPHLDIESNGLDMDGEPIDVHKENDVPVLYLVEGIQIGYLPPNVKSEIGW